MYKSLENAIRGVFTEEKADMGDVQDLLRKTLEKEGGAAGLGALEKACDEKGHKGVNVKDVLSKMSDVALHKHGDYYLKESMAKKCGEGEYWCNKDQKCKPIPQGMKVDKDGILMKEEPSGDCECTTEECDCNEPVCVTCGKERDVVREASDDHIIMQLRKAQDVRGNKEIKFRRGSAKVDPRHIDKILKLHNHPGMKPNDKRKLRIMIAKSPQDLAKVAKGIREDTTTLNYIDYNVKTISEEFILSESVKLDRFKKANRGKSPNPRQVSMYAFTTKASGDPKDKEMTIIDKPMKLADAGKEAMKKLRSKNVYVMENLEEIAPAIAAVARAAAPAIAKAVVKKASGSNNEEKEDEVKPHMMYDPKTGKGVMAKDKADHERLGKKGYVHDKPEVKEKFANAAQQAAVMAKLKKDGKYKEKNEAYNEPQGQAKSMSSPLQKARLDKEKADRDRDGKLNHSSAQRHSAALQKAQAAKRAATTNDQMTKAMNAIDFHTKALRKSMHETRLDRIIEYALKKEVKSAPKGYHFTKSGQLKKGDADVDGDGGPKLRSDPLDKQRKKIPPLPENDK